jgi:hypothetical protein
MVGGRAGLHAHQARGLFPKEVQQFPAGQPALDDNRTGRVNAMHLKDQFPEIQSDCHR